MSDTEAEMNRLASEASQLMLHDPGAAIEMFSRARELALRLEKEAEGTVFLICIARSWSRLGLHSRSIRFARQASFPGPQEESGLYTLARMCELGANRESQLGKKRRAIVLFLAARDAYARAARLQGALSDLGTFAEQCGLAAQRLFEAALTVPNPGDAPPDDNG